MVAGEPSGDLHGSGLVRELKRRSPNLNLYGIGGDQMAAAGFENLYHIDQLSLLGFTEVVRRLPFVNQVLRQLGRLLKSRRPDLVVLIDFPGFNLRLARMAKGLGVPVLYYISPQVWAWARERIWKIARWVDRMAVILPFEEKLFRQAGINARFVGHPLLDGQGSQMTHSEFCLAYDLDPNRRTIALLPGSRSTEILKLFPVMIGATERIRGILGNIQVTVGVASTVNQRDLERMVPPDAWVRLVPDAIQDVLKHAEIAIVASGTATLEAAILGVPMVIVYRVSPLSYLIGRLLVSTDYIGLVNLVAGREVVPELIQGAATAENIAATAIRIIRDSTYRQSILKDLRMVRERLGKPGATRRVADMVFEF